MRGMGLWAGAALAALAALCLPAQAEDTRGRWSIGLSGGILSTKDDIRSNASSLLLEEHGVFNDFSDDVLVGGSDDNRQDDLLGRETSIQERQKFGLSIGYGLTSWLTLQFDAGYYRGDVSNLDTFRVGQRYIDPDGDGFQNDDLVTTPFHDGSEPISAGRLEQIPVSFSAVFRFRKDSPFNPILGAGVGMIFTDFEQSDDLQDLNNRILEGFGRTLLYGNATNMQEIYDRHSNQIADTSCAAFATENSAPSLACSFGQEFLDVLLADPLIRDNPFLVEFYRAQYAPFIAREFIPTRPFITTEVENAFEYHFMGGAEYHFNERWSAFVTGRYEFTRANLKVRISDNGNLVTRNVTPDASQAIHFDTDQATFQFQSADNPSTGTIGEGAGLRPSLTTERILVQGGEINLSGFTLAFGMRFTF